MADEYKPYTIFLEPDKPAEIKREARNYDEGLMPYYRKIIALGRAEYARIFAAQKVSPKETPIIVLRNGSSGKA